MLNAAVWGRVGSHIYFQIALALVCVALSDRLPRVSPKVTEISMGEFLTHSTAVWLNPHPSLGRIRKDPEMTVFGERAR